MPRLSAVGISGLQAGEDVNYLPIQDQAISLAAINAAMPEDHRRFLTSFKRGEPDWTLPGIVGAQNLPAVLWKQRNLKKLSADKRRELAEALEKVLFP